MAVPQRTLNWLYSVLTKDHHDPKQTYQDPNRAYHDVANALAQYPSLSPRTDVYTYENGFSALLLHLVGTLPVTFRGTTYRFPVALWIPNTYPREPPIVYVTPTQDMAVRVGQHVTLEGRVYHHYLAHWSEAWDRSSIADLLMILREVFAKEPPVRNRQQMPQPQPQPTQTPPPLPPLPPGVGPTQIAQPQALSQPSTPLATQTPPQLPPKPGAAAEMQPSTQSTQTAERYQSPPALPPLPPKEHGHLRNVSAGHTPLTSPSRASQQFAHPNPLGQPRPPSIHQGFVPYERNAVGAMSPSAGHQNAAFSHPTGPVPVPQQPYHQGPPAQYPSHQSNIPPAQQQQAGPPYTPNQAYPPNHQIPPVAAAPAPKKDAPDLLTSPFELELPSFAPAGPAPPIPPNPEKDAILHALSQTLAETLRAQAAQSDTAAQSLTSQSHSLHTAITTLQSEVNTLNALHTTLTSNTTILQQSIHRADATIADAQARSASASASAPSSTPSTSTAVGTPDPRSGLPPIDEVLVAPTVVGKQLYDLVAEEQGLQHALYALQAALVRGVIGVDSWSRHTRGLAREAFLKKALTRKIGRGMGLEESFS